LEAYGKGAASVWRRIRENRSEVHIAVIPLNFRSNPFLSGHHIH
jgi:hypothetical protein